MTLIRVRDGEISPETLFAFLSGQYGQRQVQRLARPTGQYNLNLQEVSSLHVPRFSENLTQAIRQIIENSLHHAESAKQLQHDAEEILLLAIGLKNWQPPEPLTYIRSCCDAFSSGRLDADHFKPKFAELETYIRATGRFTSLEELLSINTRGTQPDYTETGLPVINSKHVANTEVRLNEDNRFATPGSNALRIKRGDVLINGTGVGTIGRAAPYLHESEALPDNHVTILRPKDGCIDPVYLSIFLNSMAGQYQVDKWLRGSSGQIELYPNDIAQFVVWIAPDDIQRSIRKAVDDAFTAKGNATRFLEAAKRAVEIAIEDSEEAALSYLKSVMDI